MCCLNDMVESETAARSDRKRHFPKLKKVVHYTGNGLVTDKDSTGRQSCT